MIFLEILKSFYIDKHTLLMLQVTYVTCYICYMLHVTFVTTAK